MTVVKLLIITEKLGEAPVHEADDGAAMVSLGRAQDRV